MAFAQIQLIPGPTVVRPTVETVSGAHIKVHLQVYDEVGAVRDLTRYIVGYSEGNPPSGKWPTALPCTKGTLVTIRDNAAQSVPTWQKLVPIIDAEHGIVELEFTNKDLNTPGLYLAELSCVYEGQIELTFSFYVEAAPSLTWQGVGSPITISEIRLWARDNVPADNFLLDEVEYKNGEIVAAIRRAIDMWNETIPLVSAYGYTPITFPYRSAWVEVTLGFLQGIAAENYLRNALNYSAGGVTIDDKMIKYKSYREDSVRRIEQYKQWVTQVKRQLNANQAYGRLGSYGLYGPRYLGPLGPFYR